MPGVVGTWDPATGQYIWMWRIYGMRVSSNGRIAYRIGGAAPVTAWSLESSDTPSIACGNPADVGSYNCLLAFTSTTRWGYVVKWTQCSVSNGDLTCLGIKTHNYYTVGSPSVAYLPNASYPWHIALSQGTSATYTWRKGPYYADNFRDQRSFSYGNESGLPAAASGLVARYPYPPFVRRYIFVPFF